MKKQNRTPSKNPLAAAIQLVNNFTGLEDWFEIFRAGEQTDSAGHTQTFTEDDLDSIVANHNADDPAPLVVGHPKTNAPAYGWTAELMREGDTLFAKGTDVAPEFDTAVKAKHFRKRSVSIVPDGSNGFKLRHIGFLGAAAPAVSGLKDIAFASDDTALDFSWDCTEEKRAIGWSLDTLGRGMRRLREYLIDQQGMEVADQLLPSWDVDNIESHASRLIEQASAASGSSFIAAGNSSTPKPHPLNPAAQGVKTMSGQEDKTFTQADIDAAIADAQKTALAQATANQEKASRFAAAKSKVKTLVDDLITKGVKPAALEGFAEFCDSLIESDTPVFEFTAAAGKVQKSPIDFTLDFIAKLQDEVIQLGKLTSASNAPVDFSENPQALAAAAQEYVSEQEKKGVTISVTAAVAHVKAQNGVTK